MTTKKVSLILKMFNVELNLSSIALVDEVLFNTKLLGTNYGHRLLL
jgi:hypothetical protein